VVVRVTVVAVALEDLELEQGFQFPAHTQLP
jgi:hypothetical protein